MDPVGYGANVGVRYDVDGDHNPDSLELAPLHNGGLYTQLNHTAKTPATMVEKNVRPKTLPSRDIEGVAQLIKAGKIKKIVMMVRKADSTPHRLAQPLFLPLSVLPS